MTGRASGEDRDFVTFARSSCASERPRNPLPPASTTREFSLTILPCCEAEKLEGFVAQLRDFGQRRGRQFLELLVDRGPEFEEGE